MKPFCYTIGHSNYCFAQFMDMLHYHGITLVIDVRSVPYSRFVPQYNREELAGKLRQHGVKYLYAGKELGGRELKESSLDEVTGQPGFLSGTGLILDRITAGETAALMCAEKDPFNCHRFFLVGYALEGLGIEVRHILESGNAVRTGLLEERLMEAYHDGLFQLNMFDDCAVSADALRRAYGRRFRDAVGQSG